MSASHSESTQLQDLQVSTANSMVLMMIVVTTTMTLRLQTHLTNRGAELDRAHRELERAHRELERAHQIQQTLKTQSDQVSHVTINRHLH
jgi:cellobiose-specific phosphotransferase system component IIA